MVSSNAVLKDFDIKPVRVSHRNNYSKKVKVAIYGRVSTEHDMQIQAFGRQLEWYEMVLKSYKNWEVVEIYTDKKTGTKASARDGFMQMIQDARDGKFSLIITREVCRFARNTVDSLSYTRALAKMNVEVFFVSDSIWSLDPDSELKLGIFSSIAQEESRKISERVLAGQVISRQNLTLYGNGNILGYDLVRGERPVDNTYIINPEQASTVRRIYELYLEGMGTKKICETLIIEGRLDARGMVHWTPGKVCRILSNKTYAGYKPYGKSVTTDYLEHSRVNKPSREHIYVKADFEPIVSEEEFAEVQRIKDSRKWKDTGLCQCKNPSRDKWTKKLRCICGKTYKKYRWRQNQNGKDIYGFKCRNQVENHRRSLRTAYGLDEEEFCDVPSVVEWKLEWMAMHVIREVWDEPKETVSTLMQIIKENYTNESLAESTDETARIQREKAVIENRAKELMLKWLDKKVDDDTYQQMKENFDKRLADIDLRLKEVLKVSDKSEEHELDERLKHLEEIQSALEQYTDFDSEDLADEVVEKFVEKVVPCGNHTYRWYLNISDSGNKNSTEWELYDFYDLGFDEAKKYRVKCGSYLRPNQWHDLRIEIYIRV